MNCILFNDESSIESIGDGDYIIIIESEYYIDDKYFNSLLTQNNNKEKKNLILDTPKGRRIITIPFDTKLSELYKSLILYFGCAHYFNYKNRLLKEKDEGLIENFSKVVVTHSNTFNSLSIITILGKPIILNINCKDDKGNKVDIIHENLPVGLLNSVKQFIVFILGITHRKIKHLFLGGNEINLEDNKSFGSLGLKEDTDCAIIFNSINKRISY